jgi:hypothetical protein
MTPGIDSNRSVASVIAGNEVSGAPGGRLSSVNPAQTELSADESFRLAD